MVQCSRCINNKNAFRLPNGAPFVGASAMDVLLDAVECGNTHERLARNQLGPKVNSQNSRRVHDQQNVRSTPIGEGHALRNRDCYQPGIGTPNRGAVAVQPIAF